MAWGGLSPWPKRFGGSESIHSAYLDVLKQQLGSAYTTENASLVGARSIALARLLGASYMLAEKVRNNALPATASDSLLSWAERLGVPVRPSDTGSAIRNACIAKYKLPIGATRQNITDSITALLSTALISITEFKGMTLSSPSTQTFWAGINPGPANLALDSDGAWTSDRCHIVISVQQTANVTLDELLYLVNVQLFSLLDILLPAYCTWAWNLGPYTGFILGVSPNASPLTYTAL